VSVLVFYFPLSRAIRLCETSMLGHHIKP